MKIINVFIIFLGGAVSSINLLAIMYPNEMPKHINGEWWEVALGLLFALIAGHNLVKEDN